MRHCSSLDRLAGDRAAVTQRTSQMVNEGIARLPKGNVHSLIKKTADYRVLSVLRDEDRHKTKAQHLDISYTNSQLGTANVIRELKLKYIDAFFISILNSCN